MSSTLHVKTRAASEARDEAAAVRMARTACAIGIDDLPEAVTAKVKLCLRDLIGCACETQELPWSVQARGLATPVATPGATIIGSSLATTAGDAAFANAVMGHGLVREDMHSGSISHLGIVVVPTLLALAESRAVRGAEFVAAVAVGYEVGGQIGRALMDADIARIHRPTGNSGPLAAAAAGARLLGLSVAEFTSAVALAANTTLGFNQWAHTGGSEMFFQAGFAARNALTAVKLAQAGAFASPSALDGEAGLLAAFGKRASAPQLELFVNSPEILSVYHKAVPVCNFAQTPSQAALQLVRSTGLRAEHIAGITIRVPHAGARYPGCDARGPFVHVLQGKMSIQFNVAAALLEGAVSEHNFSLFGDPRLQRLVALTRLEVDPAMTAAYPALQGGEVEVLTSTGETLRVRLDNVVHATDAEVGARFRAATEQVMGAARATEIAQFIDRIEYAEDAGQLARLLRASAA